MEEAIWKHYSILIKTSKKTQEAISKDKIVILNTGKNQTELEEFYDILPRVCYLNCIFGALV